jgi:hypothetical protein
MNFAKTAYLEKKLLDHVLSGENYTPPAALYLALFTANPGRAGAQTNEISDPDYTRLPITFTAAADDSVSGSYCENAYDIEFAQATVGWGTVTHVMVMDAETGGNGLYYGALDISKVIGVDDFVRVPAGELVIKED